MACGVVERGADWADQWRCPSLDLWSGCLGLESVLGIGAGHRYRHDSGDDNGGHLGGAGTHGAVATGSGPRYCLFHHPYHRDRCHRFPGFSRHRHSVVEHSIGTADTAKKTFSLLPALRSLDRHPGSADLAVERLGPLPW